MTAIGPSDAAVRAERVSKSYRIYDSAGQRLRALLPGKPRHREFLALSDVSFLLPRGKALGLIGENGAGKSTLLKIVAGTTRASSGSVERLGIVASILELGHGLPSGVHRPRECADERGAPGPERAPRSGRRLPEVRDFAELGEFFDRPVRTYSSGMVLRLAFAVATHADADVLIVDEALAVGDGYFQKKSIDRITEFHRRGGTLLFCSHALYYVALLCDQAIWLRNGEVAAGRRRRAGRPPVRGLPAGEGACAHVAGAAGSARGRRRPQARAADGGAPARRLGVRAQRSLPRARRSRWTSRSRPRTPALAFHVRVGIDREDGVQAFAVDTRHESWAPLTGARRHRIRLTVPELPIAQGDFRVYVYLGDEKALHVHDLRILKPGFTVVSPDYVVGLLRPRHVWTRRRRPPSPRRKRGPRPRLEARPRLPREPGRARAAARRPRLPRLRRPPGATALGARDPRRRGHRLAPRGACRRRRGGRGGMDARGAVADPSGSVGGGCGGAHTP